MQKPIGQTNGLLSQSALFQVRFTHVNPYGTYAFDLDTNWEEGVCKSDGRSNHFAFAAERSCPIWLTRSRSDQRSTTLPCAQRKSSIPVQVIVAPVGGTPAYMPCCVPR